MEPKFSIGTELKWTANHVPYRIGKVEEIRTINGVIHYSCNYEGFYNGFIPENELEEV